MVQPSPPNPTAAQSSSQAQAPSPAVPDPAAPGPDTPAPAAPAPSTPAAGAKPPAPNSVGATSSQTIVGLVRALGTKALGEGLSQAFSAADDDLFRRSETNQDLFAGLRELRKRQPEVTRLFLQAVEIALVRNFRLPASLSGPAPPGPASAPAQALSLVDEVELEESLAVSRMVAAAEQALGKEIHALRERTAVVRGGVDPETVEVPYAPQTVAHAFRDALSGMAGIQVSERIVVYKHFDRHAMGALGPLYHEINAELARLGILPDLKPQPLVRNHAAPELARAPEPAPSQGNGEGQPGQGQGGGSSPAEAAAWAELRSLLPSQRTPGSGGLGPAATLRDLGEAIAALREIGSLLGQLTSSGVAPQDVKEHLLQKLGQGTAAAKSLGEHEDAIDMVGLVFDHILNDPNLPPPIQALLARLQVPFLKVAVMEPQMFASNDHPARQLLELLGDTGKGWSPEADREQVLYRQIKDVVETVNREFVDDPKIFSRQHERFKAFVDDLARRAAMSQQRAEEVARSREKMAQAQAVVTRALIDVTAGKALPEWARVMLLRHWAAHMVMLVMREDQGEESPAFKKALFFAQAVVKASQASDEASRKALATSTPALVDQLRDGLTGLGLPKEDIARLATTLKAYLDMHSGQGGLVMPQLPSLPPSPAGVGIPERRGPQPRPESLETVRKLKVDDWVELLADTGRRTRGKVSWISSFTHRLLLVTLSGTRLAEKSQEDLALMLERNELRLIETRPLFGRAVETITSRLKG